MAFEYSLELLHRYFCTVNPSEARDLPSKIVQSPSTQSASSPHPAVPNHQTITSACHGRDKR
ncbi:hypothetical protein BU23DRAFT_557360 [Bimuria novae-zelandiae CBS 107.79]|uniref:Uncharacterized protein n=1 Tax=Bimuria novae-zelandiae CBS 107.79 TaxID=1447943 RepID=A0A6A5UX32_9PLEO|nr:hypothetical protein BU23DRAFT_557360 [Bimuria novae-zelandiae CBS 107.79]